MIRTKLASVFKPLQTFFKKNKIDTKSAEKLATNYQKLQDYSASSTSEKQKLEAVLSSLIDGLIALNKEGKIVFVNKAAEYLTGYKGEELQGKSVSTLIHVFKDDVEVTSKTYCQKDYNESLILVDKDGKRTKVNLISSTIAESTKTDLSCILILRDLSHEEELEQMKFDFVSMASHELKTPLTNIIGYLTVFINENRNKVEKEALELLDRSLLSARSLLSLVENLLSVNKIEREQLSVVTQPSDYDTILSKAVDDLQNQAKYKNITLTLHPPGKELPKVLLDPIRVQEVINNLISNAINYTQSGGKIDLTLRLTSSEVETCVSDTGIGIPKEAIPHLFNKFYRVSNVGQKASKGTGLGLFIAKSIIEKLNGKIWVESEEGKGSKFYFSLPIVSQTQAKISSDEVASETIQKGALNY